MIKASIVQDLFKVILSYKDGYYLKKITDGKYTGVYYHWRKLYFCNYDDKGNVTDKATEPFLDFLSITEHETYKSSLNLPTGDFVIFDEFISRYYTTNACYMFLDTIKTVFRKRKSGKTRLQSPHQTTDHDCGKQSSRRQIRQSIQGCRPQGLSGNQPDAES